MQQQRRLHRLPKKPSSTTATTTRRTVALLLATVTSTTRPTVVLSRREGEAQQGFSNDNDKDNDSGSGNGNDHEHPHPCTYTPENPVYSTVEQRCVPCLNYFDDPMEPDKGCSKEMPLCVTSSNDSILVEDNTSSVPPFQRPDWGQSGTECVPYPCHKTTRPQHNSAIAIAVDVDEGCSKERPLCVDAIGNDPPIHQPGMQCVARHNNKKSKSKSTTSSSNNGNRGVWGVVTRKPNQQQEREQLQLQFEEELAAYGLLGRTTTDTDKTSRTVNTSNNKALSCSTSSSAGMFSFCGGCPFSQAHIKTCGIANTGSVGSDRVLSW